MKRIISNKLLVIIFFIFVFYVNVEGCSFLPSRNGTETLGNRNTFINSLGMCFIHISPGAFMMGSPSNEIDRDKDELLHQVLLSKSYYMQTTEVTQGQWKTVMDSNPSNFSACGDDCPVEMVSLNDIQRFIKRMNKRGEGKYRLPTEAEWEYAARAGTKTVFNTGSDCLSPSDANYSYNGFFTSIDDSDSACTYGDYRGATMPVASFKPNEWGLYDIHGNVSEWTNDWYGPYSKRGITDPNGPESGTKRVFRGGSWDDNAGFCRSASRIYCPPNYIDPSLGFRLVYERP